jgi:hypothetical protein
LGSARSALAGAVSFSSVLITGYLTKGLRFLMGALKVELNERCSSRACIPDARHWT